MAPKPRSLLNQHGIDNLHIKHDKRTDKFYAQYRDPRNGKFHGLGGDKELSGPGIQIAKERAKQLNALIAKQIGDHRVASIMSGRPTEAGLTMGGWLVTYREILDQRLNDGDYKKNTWKQAKSAINVVDRQFGSISLRAITVKQIADWLKGYKKGDRATMGQHMRKWMVDIFREAVQAGECEDNPAEKTVRPKAKVKRARLTLDAFETILATAEKHLDPWVANSMLLGLITAQRRDDVRNMRFRDFDGGYLRVDQGKTGTKIMIPEALTLKAVNISLEDIKRRCRDNVVSPYLIHHTKPQGYTRAGERVGYDALTEKFAEARDKAGLSWGDHTPPTFHEIRSLAGRLYRDEGLDTQSLYGHKHSEMTDTYHDARGHDWVVVKLNIGE